MMKTKLLFALAAAALLGLGIWLINRNQEVEIFEIKPSIGGQLIQPVSPNPSFRPSPRPGSNCQPSCLGRLCLQLPCRESQ